MKDEDAIVVLHRARTTSEAQVILAVLRSAGIPAYVAGTLLQDEFAASQSVMGLAAVDIQVPRTVLQHARNVLAEARKRGSHVDRPLGDGRFDEDPRRN